MKLHDGPRLTVTKANVSTDETLPRRYVEPGVGVSKHVRWGRFAQVSLTVQAPNSTRYYSARLYLHNRDRTTARLIQAESERTGWPVGQVHLDSLISNVTVFPRCNQMYQRSDGHHMRCVLADRHAFEHSTGEGTCWNDDGSRNPGA